MSVEGIRSIIRRHTGENPKEPGMIPHSEVQAMIESAMDGGRITPRERAELLAVIAMFGSNIVHPDPLLEAGDEQAIKDTAVSGIETAADFQQRSVRDRANFVIYCVLLGSAQYIGVSQTLVHQDTLSPRLQRYLTEILDANVRKAGADKYGPPDSVGPVLVSRNGETYGYILNASFPARDESGHLYVTNVLGADASFYREVYGDFEPNEPD